MAKAKTSITTENRSGSAADAAAKEKRTEMPFSDLHPFEGHPFKVLDDELMEQTVESIKQIGVVSPLIVRPDPEGGFEILSGHRRLHAAQLAGLETVPVIVKEMDDDAAIIFMVDSNLQRENILPSERAFSYKMKLEAMKHQGQRKDLTSEQFAPKLSTEIIGEAVGMSKDTVKRYIRLTNLIPEILDMVDEKKIAFNPAVELSYLKPSEQKEFLEAMDYAQASPSLSQAQRLKKLSQEGGCTLDAMCEVMNEVKKDELDHVTIKNEVLRKYFPKSYTPKQMQDTIIRLLENGSEVNNEIWNDEKEIFMMMNFKKNQNNAVCSMDCKNCPHGASQPNPMDDPMFEKSIAMLHNWLMLEAIREDHPKERIVMVILPGAGGELLTEDGSRDIFEDVYDEMEADLVADGELLLHYDKSDVIETDRTRYLLGAAEVSEIDQNGNECSINLFTLERTIDYVNENLTVVSIGGELVPALRLI